MTKSQLAIITCLMELNFILAHKIYYTRCLNQLKSHAVLK